MIFFLDRDGTINVDFNFVHRKEEWVFCDGAPEAIRRMNEAGYKVVVVTNQSGIVRNKFTLEQVMDLHKWVDLQLAQHHAFIDAWYIAPWHPDMHNNHNPALLLDRKPSPGMFERAASRFFATQNLHQQKQYARDNTTDIYERLHQPVYFPPNADEIFARSFMAGDKITDLQPAISMGMTPLFIKSRWFDKTTDLWLKRNEVPIYDRLIDAVEDWGI